MREFKFRACEEEKNTWTNWKCYDNMFYFMNKYTGVWIRDDEFERFTLMQYTGLKDKNGIDVYEGDIIHAEGHCQGEGNFNTGEHDYNFTGVVIWDKKQLTYTCSRYKLSELDEVTIIGNIYENSELIGEEKR